MKLFIGVTDNDWFDFLSRRQGLDEVNFWQPSGKNPLRSLNSGELFLFKLHKPYDKFIAGGGFFVYSSILPVSLAWEAFGEKNGAASYGEMKNLIEKYHKSGISLEDYRIGCIFLCQPFFLKKEDWIPVPQDFSHNIVRGKTYDAAEGYGRDLWQAVLGRLQAMRHFDELIAEPKGEYGKPLLIKPRLGQGSFRVIVTDIYERQSAITKEKVLPALEAAHIKPFSASGPHSVKNGILLRSDVHKLFDAGYVTVTSDYRVEVSRRIREEFDNGKYYFTFQGKRIHLPENPKFGPDPEYLTWHNEHVFKG